MLVLDDYHVIESPEIHESMAFLVEHLPPQIHLVIASRADPPLPLASLRARGELLEFRAADLRFTADEAAAYLNDEMGLAIDAPTDIDVLDARTEGWIAALQLAALSMQGRDDTQLRSSPGSPATTASSSTTSSRRCSNARPTTSAASCSRPRS